MIEKIKSCPFCGGKKIWVCRTNENACWIRCDKCWGETESASDRKTAIKNWNRERIRIRTFDTKIVQDDEVAN
jgi:hypothetical protein